MSLKVSAKKVKYLNNEYYKAVLTVVETKQQYYSSDVFIDSKTALEHANWWKNESLLIGQITRG